MEEFKETVLRNLEFAKSKIKDNHYSDYICINIQDYHVMRWFRSQQEFVPERFKGGHLWSGGYAWWRKPKSEVVRNLKVGYLKWLISEVKSGKFNSNFDILNRYLNE